MGEISPGYADTEIYSKATMDGKLQRGQRDMLHEFHFFILKKGRHLKEKSMKYERRKPSSEAARGRKRQSGRHVSEPQYIRHMHHAQASCRDQFSLGPQSVPSSKPGPAMWRTGLRGSIYEVQRECLSWWVMDSKLITPPPPVSHNEQKLCWGTHYKDYWPSAQCAIHTLSRRFTAFTADSFELLKHPCSPEDEISDNIIVIAC